jgi:hypothetical protein
MENTTNGNTQNSGLPNPDFNRNDDNAIPSHVEATASDDIFAETAPVRTISLDTTNDNSSKDSQSYDDLPYADPALVNPEELASFPDPAPKEDASQVEFESENRLVNRKPSPVREGRNIAQSDNRPDENGYI